MKRTLQHSWKKQEGTGKLKHKKCEKCNCEQYYTDSYSRVIFINNRGYTYFVTPTCIPI